MKKTCLQGVENGNALALETIIGVVQEIAEKLDQEVPDIST
jgi:hypothetical protein